MYKTMNKKSISTIIDKMFTKKSIAKKTNEFLKNIETYSKTGISS